MTRTIYSLLFMFVTCFAFAQNTVTVTDATLVGNTDYTWTSNNEYLLDGYVFLEEGSRLFIEPGTVIKGKQTPTSTDRASALIITRGAQIFAEGTSRNPIIFTAEDDDVNDPTDVLPEERGLWGGLIILGRASITDNATEVAIEGVAADPNDTRVLYGAAGGNFDDEDNSGVLKYVSVRHGGSKLEDGDEINGITLGAVGSKTMIDYVDVYANDDDGIEWFGGTVNVTHAVVAFCKDDSYDWDTGFKGKGQFWLSIHGADRAGNGGEHDGAKPDDANPGANPLVYNATFIGAGVNSSASGQDNDHALLFRDNSAGTYANSIFTDYTGFAIQVEDVPAMEATQDSRKQMEDGVLVLKNNIWFGFNEGSELNAGPNGIINPTPNADDPAAMFLVDHLGANANSLEDPNLRGISRSTDQGFDPRPNNGSPVFNNLADLPENDPFFQDVSYKGAFGTNLWIRGWTALDANGHIPASPPACIITDADLVGNTTYNWTNDKEYILDGYVFLEEGGVLNIEPGTVIKGQMTPSNTDRASALIITRGAKINAIGTAEMPIIFTAEDDDVNDPTDVLPEERGLWGGLIILGRASITDNATEVAIEGVAADPNDTRVLYGAAGGNFNDEDDSGVLRYVSVRHGGSKLEDGDEINGITLGAVGSRTEIEFVEVFANDDDGIEWFGGTVDVKHAVVAICKDDSYDWDTGFKGKGQFWLSIHGADRAGNGGEHDGAKPDDADPGSNPVVYNATFIGAGVNSSVSGQDNDHALLFRDNSAGTYANSIFTDFTGFAIQVEDVPTMEATQDSRKQMEDGNLVLKNNIWFGFNEGSELNAGANGIINPTPNADDPAAMFLVDHLGANANTLEDPQLIGISRTTDGGLDPRPAANGAAFNNVAEVPNDDFFCSVDYKGAFSSDDIWIKGWTALDEYGYLAIMTPSSEPGCITTSTEELVAQSQGYLLGQNVPNPAGELATITFTLPVSGNINFEVYNAMGQVIQTVARNTWFAEGEHIVELNTVDLPNGMYFYRLSNPQVQLTKSMIIQK